MRHRKRLARSRAHAFWRRCWQLLNRCSEFFLDHGQYDRAVRLFTVAGDYMKALDLCALHNIPLSDESADKMTPALGDR